MENPLPLPSHVLRTLFSLLLAWLWVSAPAQAQELEGRTLVVGTKVAPPFAMQAPDGTWSGLSISLVEGIARELGATLRFEEGTLTELVAGTAEGRFDLAASALTVTPAREEGLDFSHPYMDSGLGIAVPLKPSRDGGEDLPLCAKREGTCQEARPVRREGWSVATSCSR